MRWMPWVGGLAVLGLWCWWSMSARPVAAGPRASAGAPERVEAFAGPGARQGPPDDLDRQLSEPSAPVATPAAAAPPVAREVLVVDADGAPVAGATVGVEMVWDADGGVRGEFPPVVTGRDGKAHVAIAGGRELTVAAPGLALFTGRADAGLAPWRVVLRRAHRLELVLTGVADARGCHAEVELPATFAARTFWQGVYQQTPGRCTDGTAGAWRERCTGGESAWTLAFTVDGHATLDQIEGEGTVRIGIWRFGTRLLQREAEFAGDGGTLRVEFAAPAEQRLVGTVVDVAGRPVAGVAVRMAPCGGETIVDSSETGSGFPPWAPRAETDAAGAWLLPRPADAQERVCFHRDGLADRVLTIAELDATGGRVALAPGCVVRLECVDCNGAPMDGGWTTSGHDYVEPSVHIGHDVWRGASRDEHPAVQGQGCRLPWFLFADLPPGPVQFRCTYLRGEVLAHDARIPVARFVASMAVDDLQIGK